MRRNYITDIQENTNLAVLVAKGVKSVAICNTRSEKVREMLFQNIHELGLQIRQKPADKSTYYIAKKGISSFAKKISNEWNNIEKLYKRKPYTIEYIIYDQNARIMYANAKSFTSLSGAKKVLSSVHKLRKKYEKGLSGVIKHPFSEATIYLGNDSILNAKLKKLRKGDPNPVIIW